MIEFIPPFSLKRTCTIITGEPNEFVRQIHNRMPVILPEEHHDSWLSGEAGSKYSLRLYRFK
jgi:putative SOS response-associated peptidase YedK